MIKVGHLVKIKTKYKYWLLICSGCFLIIRSFIWLERLNCRTEAEDLGLKWEYHFHFIPDSTCIYVLPNGKKVLSINYWGQE